MHDVLVFFNVTANGKTEEIRCSCGIFPCQREYVPWCLVLVHLLLAVVPRVLSVSRCLCRHCAECNQNQSKFQSIFINPIRKRFAVRPVYLQQRWLRCRATHPPFCNWMEDRTRIEQRKVKKWKNGLQYKINPTCPGLPWQSQNIAFTVFRSSKPVVIYMSIYILQSMRTDACGTVPS